MDLALTEHIINQVSYTSTAADSFCAVDGSVKVFFQTHAAKLDITGMKDEQLLNRFILHSGDVELSSVSLEEDFHGTINSAERVGSGGGVADLVDDVLGEGKVHGTISGDVE